VTDRNKVFDRIVSDPTILGGKPTIRETRISVEVILEWLQVFALPLRSSLAQRMHDRETRRRNVVHV
jgi:hypothetical protein